MIKTHFYLLILLILSLAASAQKVNDSNFIEDSLRQELLRTTIILESKKKETDCLLYLLTAKEMAIRSIELKDSIFQGLVAVQAFNFNTNYEGNKNDTDIYRALFQALQRFGHPSLTIFSKIPNKTNNELVEIESKMAEKLCSQIKRNMTVFEWEKFSPGLNYEKTCGR